MNEMIYALALLSVVGIIGAVEVLKRVMRWKFALTWKQELLIIRIMTFVVAFIVVQFGDAPLVKTLLNTDMAQWYDMFLTIAGYAVSAWVGYDVLKRVSPSTKSLLEQQLEILKQQDQ